MNKVGGSFARLYRSSQDRMLGGICGGLGEIFEIDPTIVRLLWVGLTFLTSGLLALAYVVAWIVVPQRSGEPTLSADPAEGEDTESPATKEDGGGAAGPATATRPATRKLSSAAVFAGLVLIAIGSLMIVGDFAGFDFWDLVWSLIGWFGGKLWPAILIAVGATILLVQFRKRR